MVYRRTSPPFRPSVHMRHTDRDYIGGATNDTLVIDWIASKTGPVFVLSDNKASFELLRGKFPDRVVGVGRFLNATFQNTGNGGIGNGKSETDLAHIVVDMWVASYSHNFAGSAGSSFSQHILHMRHARGITNPGELCNTVCMKVISDFQSYGRL